MADISTASTVAATPIVTVTSEDSTVDHVMDHSPMSVETPAAATPTVTEGDATVTEMQQQPSASAATPVTVYMDVAVPTPHHDDTTAAKTCSLCGGPCVNGHCACTAHCDTTTTTDGAAASTGATEPLATRCDQSTTHTEVSMDKPTDCCTTDKEPAAGHCEMIATNHCTEKTTPCTDAESGKTGNAAAAAAAVGTADHCADASTGASSVTAETMDSTAKPTTSCDDSFCHVAETDSTSATDVVKATA